MHSVKALLVLPALVAGAAAQVHARGSSPKLSYDPSTTKDCSWWFDNASGASCKDILSDNYITIDKFRAWNPSVGADCSGLKTGFSYCVEGPEVQPPPASTSSSTTPKTTAKPTSTTLVSSVVPTTTKPSNGITTPEPTQKTIVDNCEQFYLVRRGDTCDDIAAKFQISASDVISWNPSAGPKCSGLWSDAYACVKVIGYVSKPTSTKPANGIETPQPTQPDMVGNCNKFHFISKGNTCDQITSYQHISQDQFARWNPKIGKDCSGLQADAFACVGVVKDDPPTPTKPANGIETPQPTQPSMVDNCNKFHFISKGNTCDQITSYQHISQDQFALWNPKVGKDCTGLWSDAFACVGVVKDYPPTPSKPANGIETPQPTQPGMVDNCKKFHFISKGNTCDQITSYQHISQDDFARWNPKIGKDCTGLWSDAFACVGVL